MELIHKSCDGLTDLFHGPAPALPPVDFQKENSLALCFLKQLLDSLGLRPACCLAQGIDDSIAGNNDVLLGYILGQEIIPGLFCGRKVPGSDLRDQEAISFFRKRESEAPASEACLHVADGYPAIKSSQGCGEGGSGITVHQDAVWLFLLKNGIQPLKHSGCDLGQLIDWEP